MLVVVCCLLFGVCCLSVACCVDVVCDGGCVLLFVFCWLFVVCHGLFVVVCRWLCFVDCS